MGCGEDCSCDKPVVKSYVNKVDVESKNKISVKNFKKLEAVVCQMADKIAKRIETRRLNKLKKEQIND